MDFFPSGTDVILRLAAAVVLGGVIGLEREWRQKPAGLRTHMIVALGASVFVLTTLQLYRAIHEGGGRSDPIHVVAAVVTAVGFLGAGSIIQSRGSVEGLTTAASLWLVGAVGLASGFGELGIAAWAVVLGVIVLRGMEALAKKVTPPTSPS